VTGLRIGFLKDNLRFAKRLAELCARQWQHLYLDWAEEAALQEFNLQRNDGMLPLSLVALQNDELVGSVSLIFDDLPEYEHLNPWVAGLLVLPEYRKMGVASYLVREAERLFLFNGICKAQLFTESAGGLFGKLGWIVAESGTCRHYPIVILEKEFRSNKPMA
jgi:GNAT superfamily N-acetyltransferase